MGPGVKRMPPSRQEREIPFFHPANPWLQRGKSYKTAEEARDHLKSL
jgi:hypothetical protein